MLVAGSGRAGVRREIRGGLTAGVVALLLAGGSLGAAETDPLKTAEQAAGKWVDLRTEASRLENDWNTQKPLLNSLIQALTDRAQTLETKRDYLAAKSAKDTEELGAIEAANRAGIAATDATATRVKAVADQLIQLRAALPPRLATALEMSYRTLAKPDASVNERTQIALTVLSRCVQFNRDVSYGQESLTLPGESGERVVEVLYWGLSQGYALDRSANRAWVGRPEGGSWTWKPQPEAAPAIARLMAVQQDKANPTFVAIPAQVAAPAGR